MSDFDSALFIKATLQIYRECAVKAYQGLIRNWLIIIGSVIAFILLGYVLRIFAPMGLAGGMLAGLVQIALLSLYYSWIAATLDRERLKWKDLVRFDYSMFFIVISVAFIFFIIQFLVRTLVTGLNADWVLLMVQLGLVIAFNAIPEVLIVHRYESVRALSSAANFTRENWIEWFLPFLLLVAPWLLVSSQGLLVALAQTDPLMPALVVVTATAILFSGTGILGVIAGVVVANWFMLFRAHLFRELESGTRRRRMYAAKQ